MRGFILTIITLLSISCGALRLVKLNDKVAINTIEKIELKGLTGLQLSINISNESKYLIAMNEGVITIKSNGERVATLTQKTEATIDPNSSQSVKSIWKISNVDPLTLLNIVAKVSKNDLDGLYIDYSARLSAGKLNHTISDKDVDLKKFITIFASKNGK